VELVPDSGNFKIKKQVHLTTALTKELDCTIEEVEFWQEKYEEVMKIVRKLKRQCPQDVETLSKEEIEELTPTCYACTSSLSFPRMMMSRSGCSWVGVFFGLASFV
jgi:hypothetical protein